jgi:hypothetical protein
MTGLSLRFQRQEQPKSWLALKGQKIFLIEDAFRGTRLCRTFGSGLSFYQDLGLKPQAESYHPFGIKPPNTPGICLPVSAVGTFTALAPSLATEGARPRFFCKTDRLSVASLVNYHVFRQPTVDCCFPLADE